MKMVTCTLTFKDGTEITARAESSSLLQVVPVQYFGEVGRLPRAHEASTLDFLEWYLRVRAANLGARFDVFHAGEFCSGNGALMMAEPSRH
jgi:hypothetical protein